METKTISTAEAVPTVLLKIDHIDVDPNQPRKTFEEIQEMADSIKSVGKVLQPIAVRPVGKRHVLIYGERRLKGSQLAGLEYIPSNVYNVSEEEAKVMQLIENLQRKELHPMQQAKGFFTLAHTEKLSTDEIARRLGKTVYFVRQQLRLNDLTPEWQSIFLRNGIPLGIAMQICILPEESQRHLYENQVSEEDEKEDNPRININTYVFNRYKGDLSEACFDPTDAELDAKMGPCTACPFNSACGSLFPEEEKKPRCNNIKCFQNKTSLHKNRELAKAKEDPMTVIVYDGQPVDEVKQLQKEGIEVHPVGYGEEFRYVTKPEKPDWNTFSIALKKKKVPAKQIKGDFAIAEKEYQEQNEEFETGLSIGKIKRAFIVSSNNWNGDGKYAYVEFVPKTSNKDIKKTLKAGAASFEIIDDEIKRLQTRETRAKELDQEKIQRKIADAVKTDKSVNVIPKKPTGADSILINYLLLEHLPFHLKSAIQKVVKCSALKGFSSFDQFKNGLRSLTKPQITYLIRKIIIEKHSNSLADSRSGFAFRLMAESLGTIPIADFEKQQREIASKRQANVNKCIGVLNEQRKEALKKTNQKKKVSKLPEKSAKSKAA